MNAGATIFLTSDAAGDVAVLAALEERPDGALGREGARARRQLVPDLDRLASDDFRGRRIDLGTLLLPSPPRDSSESALELIANIAAHMTELPEMGAPEQLGRSIPLRVRYLQVEAPELPARVPAPGGGDAHFELDLAPVEFPSRGPVALLRTNPVITKRRAKGAVAEHAWVRQIGAPDPSVEGLLALLRESGLAGLEPGTDSFLDEWIRRDTEAGGLGASGSSAAQLVDRIRARLGDVIGGVATAEGDPQIRITNTTHERSAAWAFDVDFEGRTAQHIHPAARVSEAAITRLRRAACTPLVPWWLLVWNRGTDGETTLAEVLDARAYLVRHPELWEHPGTVPSDASDTVVEPIVDEPEEPQDPDEQVTETEDDGVTS